MTTYAHSIDEKLNFAKNSIKLKVSNYRMLFRSKATRREKAGTNFNASSWHRRLADKIINEILRSPQEIGGAAQELSAAAARAEHSSTTCEPSCIGQEILEFLDLTGYVKFLVGDEFASADDPGS